MGRIDPNIKSSFFLISYKILFTIFPQMWITEKTDFTSNEGQKYEDGVNINPFKINFKSFF
jgi:hypothetical protein